jgi:hypothetical protein
LCAAAAARIWRADLAQVGYDESAAASLVAAWRFDGLFPLTGIVSSVGIPNPPAWPYLMALVLLPTANPQALVGLGIAVSLLSTTLTWWIGRRWLGPWGGLSAAAFYAGSFWALLLGRSPWQPAFLQVPVLLCLDALLILAIQRRPWALAVACGWLGLMAQLHYIAVGYALLLPFAAWPARRSLRPGHVIGALLAGLAPLVPFLVYELHPAVRLRELTFLVDQATGGTRTDLEAARLLFTLAGNGGIAGLGGPNVGGLQAELGRWSALGLVGAALLTGGLLVGSLDGARGRLIVAWAVLPVLVLARHTLDVLFHYLYLDLPGVALAVGLLGAWCARRGWLISAAFGALVSVYVAASVISLVVVLDYVDRVDSHLGYGMPLRFSLAAGQAARAVLPAGGQVVVEGAGFEAEVVRFAIGYDVPSRIVQDCAAAPPNARAVHVLMSEHTSRVADLSASGVVPWVRIERPGDAYLVYRPMPTGVPCAQHP